MIPNNFINNSYYTNYTKKEIPRMKGNYPLFQHLGSIHYEVIKNKEKDLCQSANKQKQ